LSGDARAKWRENGGERCTSPRRTQVGRHGGAGALSFSPHDPRRRFVRFVTEFFLSLITNV
jgi:hypothetical protein